MCSYGMLSAIDGKTKPMYLVYGDEVFRRSGFPEYMSATALTRMVHRDSCKSRTMDKHPEEYAGASASVRRGEGGSATHPLQQHFGM